MKLCCCILVHVNAAIVWENDVIKALRSSSNLGGGVGKLSF